MVTIIQKEHPTLRKKAQSIPPEKIVSENIQKIIADMKAALSAQKDGVALAAPQINQLLRIFIVAGKVFVQKSDSETASSQTPSDKVFINPEIIKLSRKKEVLEEGCLSVQGVYGKTQRAQKATVRAYDEEGRQFTLGGSGLLAQIFQHEIDHLNGILFTDHATEVQDIQENTQ